LTQANRREHSMIDIDPRRVIEMTAAELGSVVLRDLVGGGSWSQWNYINEAQQGRYRGEAANAISGALGWLAGQGFIAHDPRNGSSWGAFVVTPEGHRAAR
jgi:hypothetical protein